MLQHFALSSRGFDVQQPPSADSFTEEMTPTKKFRKAKQFEAKFPPIPKMSQMLETERDCPDRICFLTFKQVDNCLIYTKTEKHKMCDVPCDQRDCAIEIFHNVICPTWVCTMKPTTPAPSTTPAPPPSNFACTTPSCIAAASSSGAMGLFVLFLAALLWRKKNVTQRLRARLSLYERLDEESTPIFRQPNLATPINNPSPAILRQPLATVRGQGSFRAGWRSSEPNAVNFEAMPINDQSVENVSFRHEAETRF